MKTVNERIAQLRTIMESKNIDALILPSNDPHQSEYVADYWKIREYFSGFTGSAGTLILTQKEAALWTDSRYFLQAESELKDSCVQLHKQTIPHAPEHIPWLCNLLNAETSIGIDFKLFSLSQMEYLKKHAYPFDLAIVDGAATIEESWTDRPSYSTRPIVDHPLKYCGEDRNSKLKKVQNQLTALKAQYNFISSLDEIAWLFNIRSADVDFTPLATAYALVGIEKTVLFIDIERVDSQLKSDLNSSNIELLAYAEVQNYLGKLGKAKRILADPSSLNYACYSSFQGEWLFENSLVQFLKSIKNPIEIENAKEGMVKDGIALTKFFLWMERHLYTFTMSEFDIGRQLEKFRREQPLYKYQSFDAIVGYQENGAIIHYTAPEEGSAEVRYEGILLIDSGAQYENATTDITRTVWLSGTPSEELKMHYTAVLKGHIALDTLVFPEKTSGVQIDAFARMHLWQEGLNYGHGTGHGIGSYGMVHEPGQGFASSTATSRGTTAHKENQFSTIEPGFYKEGEYGIRIENVVLSKVVKETEFGRFLGFEALTLCPIETKLIDLTRMTTEEINWVNAYHQKVYDSLSKHLNEMELEWLKFKCEPLEKK